ncbi:unnamed protein product, partial [Ixodes hexagonus]
VSLHSLLLFIAVQENTITEVLTPIAMMLVLGIMHAQVVATYTTTGQLKPIRAAKSKRPRRKTRSRDAYDGKSSPGTASEEKTESVWSEFHTALASGGSVEKGPVRRRAKPERSLSRNCLHAPPGGLPVQPDQLNLGPFQHRRSGGKNSDEESGLESLSNHNGPEELCLAQMVQDKLACFLDVSSTGQEPGREATTAVAQAIEREPSSDDEEFFVARKQRSRSHDVCCNDSVLLNEWRNPASTRTSPHRRGSNEHPGGRAEESSAEEDEEDKDRPQRRRSSPPDLPPKPSSAPNLHSRRRAGSFFATLPTIRRCDYNSSCESDKDTTMPNTPVKPPASDIEWPLLSNTDCNGYTSSSEGLDGDEEDVPQDPFSFDAAETSGPLAGGQTSLDKVSCTIWENGECKKVDLSVMDIASAIIHKASFMTVDCMIHSTEYVLLGLLLTAVTSTLPLLFRLQSSSALDSVQLDADVLVLGLPREVRKIPEVIHEVFYQSRWSVSSTLLTICLVERFSLGAMFFFLLSVAERTFKQRFLYAKYFCHLTSARRALRSDLPHFRLNKVRNIKTWLSVRSYLKKHGPQRSVDVIVSTAFIIGVCILSFLCVQWLKENEQFAERLYCWEMVCWSMALGIFLMRFMILGSKINKKYRNLSVLITEQINLYLHMEQKPHKKEELMLANNVVRIFYSLFIAELESPFKISGLCANPYLYNITKVVCLSAFSAALTELFGFKLKLHKIKIK